MMTRGPRPYGRRRFRAAALSMVSLAIAAIMAGALGAPQPSRAEPAAQPVLVELFTSQGCSSCPPADAFLGELAERDDVIALSYHVDYWNYIGWADPFSSAEATQRQREYGRALGLRVVYTPQMVIDGRWDAVGSNRRAVEGAIAAAAAERHLPLAIAGDVGSGRRLVLPATTLPEPARMWIVLYDRAHETEVKRGENAGRKLEHRNVVRGIVELGAWDGSAREIALALDPALTAGRDGCAIIVQQGRTGPVLGAVAMSLAE